MEEETKFHKIVRIGQGHGLVIPTKWMEEHELQSGDPLKITFNGVLKVTPVKIEVHISQTQIVFIKDSASLKITKEIVVRALNKYGIEQTVGRLCLRVANYFDCPINAKRVMACIEKFLLIR